jgi:hypothetical protein
MREIPANCAACPLDSRPISNSFMASAMRASFSKRSALEPDEAAQDSGYSICIAFTPTTYAQLGRKKANSLAKTARTRFIQGVTAKAAIDTFEALPPRQRGESTKI